mmetsp:Transcript_62748/g.147126  ORF Transcript_62748/g.147126 Transcript_62748/m.147126 type:complete len:478 (+) Transcript_62748:55-1488(+)
MTAMVPEPAPTLQKIQIPQKEIDEFVRKNSMMLSSEAKDLFCSMGAEDQRRVLNSGPLNIFREVMAMYKFRVAISREREQEIADRKGGEFVAKEASEAEVKDWCRANKDYLGEEGVKQIDMFGTADQWRIISEGPAAEHMDSVHVIQQRAKRSREMANTVAVMFAQRREMANKGASENVAAKAAAKPLFNPTMADTVQAFFTRVVGAEVPESQRRCGGFGVQHQLEEDRSKLVGKVKGVDGVVEILKAKYECMKGDRYRVIGDHGGPAGMWRLECGKTVPKTHVKEGGWRWVLEEPEPEAKLAKPPPVQTTPVETFTPKEHKKLQAEEKSEESSTESEERKPTKKKKRKAPPARKVSKKAVNESEEDEEDEDDEDEKPKRSKKRVAGGKRKLPSADDDSREAPRKKLPSKSKAAEDSRDDDSRETTKSRKKVGKGQTGLVRVRVKKRKVRRKPAEEDSRDDASRSQDSRRGGRSGRR